MLIFQKSELVGLTDELGLLRDQRTELSQLIEAKSAAVTSLESALETARNQ